MTFSLLQRPVPTQEARAVLEVLQIAQLLLLQSVLCMGGGTSGCNALSPGKSGEKCKDETKHRRLQHGFDQGPVWWLENGK